MTIKRSIVSPLTVKTTTPASSLVPSYAWKSAYAILGATVLAVGLGIGFFTRGGIFAPFSDAGGLLVGIFLAPLVWAMYLLNGRGWLNRGVSLVGAAAAAGIGVGSIGLIVVYLLSLNPEIYGAGFLGVQFLGWFLLGVGALGLRNGTVGRRPSWAAVVSGIGTAGGIVTLLYSYAVGSFTLAFPLFMALYAVGFVLWAFWLGDELRPTSTDSDVPNASVQ